MARVLLTILLWMAGCVCYAQNAKVTVNDLLTLYSISPRNIDSYLGEKGFAAPNTSIRNGVPVRTYLEKAGSGASRSIDTYRRDGTYWIEFKTTSADEFSEGRSTLKNAGFFYDRDTSRANALIFKKGSITVNANTDIKENNQQVYNFVLQKKEFPDPGKVQFAEDLLRFESHEHLLHYFGAEHVKKDVYHFSEKESVNCSVLYPNSAEQVVFIWEDDLYLYKISFIMISGELQTVSTVQYNGNFSHNKWKLSSGVYVGMRIKDLVKLNSNDFTFYGRKSDYSFMAVPEKTRYIDFKKIGVMFDCFDCYNAPLLNTEKVSAAEAADQGLSLYVSCIMISP